MPQGLRWTENEENILKVLWPKGMTIEEISYILDRDPKAIKNKAGVLKLLRGNFKPKPKTAKRNEIKCLCCQNLFKSQGIYNRLCNDCK